MIKKSLILTLLLICMMVMSVNAVTVELVSPVNATYSDSANVAFRFNITAGNSSSWKCNLYTDDSGTWSAVQTDSSVTNATATSFVARTISDATGLAYHWNVFCNSSNDVAGAWGSTGNFSLGVDTVDPSVVIDYGIDIIDTSVRFGLTITDDNPGYCKLYSTLNASKNTSESSVYVIQIPSYSNATAFNFTYINSSTVWVDSANGSYSWYYVCNDTANNVVTGTSQRVYVDTVKPTPFIFNVSMFKTSKSNVQLANQSKSTDYIPQIGWNLTVEANFSMYRIKFYDTNYTKGIYIEKNISSISTVFTNMSTLLGDTDYMIMITAYDLAGNYRNMTVSHYQYKTESTGRSLQSGWSIIMNPGTAKNMSDYLIQTGATTISYFNSTNQFVSHVSGGSNGATDIPAGDPVFIYLSSADYYTDGLENTTAVSISGLLRNESNTDWNIECNRNSTDTDGKTFQEIDLVLNTGSSPQANTYNNVTFMSYFNWSASSNQYVPFMANISIHNSTAIEFGECAWMYLGSSSPLNQTINWGLIG